MPAQDQVHRSPLGLTVLWMLAGGPLHPYAIQSRMKAWGKDQVVNVGQRANLYKTIERLLAGGLITVSHIDRTPGFPERTSYELTEEGWRHAISWLEHMLAHPRNEFPEFPAALSFIFGLTPAAARKALEQRASALAERLEQLESELNNPKGPPRVFLLETEYLRAATVTELDWLRAVIADLKDRRLSWRHDEIKPLSESFAPREATQEPAAGRRRSTRSRPL